ncbi:uncharacterized protein LOC143039962 isoform X2 [Oratosquilla oratoria]|uniref:uncharacterized protein LOC143039962 isoform X2 n=1 Tax=Oratosquilla oratoria TaxID=337810 RepID=UPI003F75DA86
MMSNDGGSGGKRWWESDGSNSTLTPEDLRPHLDSWSLATDAATATLLHTMSQKLISRTHEVEAALKKVVQDSETLGIGIANTNNAFHMLANSQFIENRTYQDDVHIPQPQDEQLPKKPTEEEIFQKLGDCLKSTLKLVDESYEKHEIQDSDSEDEDSPGSPVPIYVMVDVYEHRALPYIIGSSAFVEEDRIGLNESSTEENTATTVSSSESEASEDENDAGMKAQTVIHRIPQDDSDSDWSDEEIGGNQVVTKSSHADNGDISEESPSEDLFKIHNNLNDGEFDFASDLSKKFGNPDIKKKESTPVLGSSDDPNDEDGLFKPSKGLFGSGGGLFPDFEPPPIKQNSKNSLFDDEPVLTTERKSSVDSVRAMPDTKIKKRTTPVTTTKTKRSDLFGSSSDSDEGLFVSTTNHTKNESRPSPETVGTVKPQNKTTCSALSDQPPPVQSMGSSLFMSDGDEEDGLFANKPRSSSGTSRTKEEDAHEQIEPKKAGPKKPAGAVSIFGPSITAAIQRPVSSESEGGASDNDSVDWKTSRPSSSKPAISEKITPQSKAQDIPNKEKKQPGPSSLFSSPSSEDDFFAAPKPKSQPKVSPPVLKEDSDVKSKAKPKDGGLFDSPVEDDDELFSGKTTVPVTTSTPVPTSKNSNIPVTGSLEKGKVSQDNKASSKPITSSIFSDDDDDDLFAPVVAVPQVPSNSSSVKSISQDHSTNETVKESVRKPEPSTKLFGDTNNDSNLFSPSVGAKENGTDQSVQSRERTTIQVEKAIGAASQPQPIPDTKKKEYPGTSLFSSPSSDEDLFSIKENKSATPKTTEVKAQPQKEPPVFTTEPAVIKKEPSTAVTSKVETKKPKLEDSLFGSASDEDDLFSPVSSSSNKGASNSKQESQTEPQIFQAKSTVEKSSEPKSIPASKVNVSPKGDPFEDDLFSTSPRSDREKPPPSAAEENKPVEPAKPIDIPKVLPKTGDSLFSSPDTDDLFTVGKQEIGTKKDQIEKASPSVSEESKPPESSNHLPISKPTATPSLFESLSDSDDIFSDTDKISSDVKVGKPEKSKPTPIEKVAQEEKILSGGLGESVTSSDQPKSKLKKEDINHISEKGDINECVKDFPDKPEEKEKEFETNKHTSVSEPERKNKEEASGQKGKDDKDIFTESVPEQPPVQSSPVKAKSGHKPPIGGVALFGGAELLAKVNQRKSMLMKEDSDDDSSEGSRTVEPPELVQKKKPIGGVSIFREPPPLLRSSSETKVKSTTEECKTSEASSPVRAFAPISPAHPHLPLTSEHQVTQKGISFEEPVSTSTLHSLSKNRARGSTKRRLPSRASLRRGPSPSTTEKAKDTTDSQKSKTPSPDPVVDSSSKMKDSSPDIPGGTDNNLDFAGFGRVEPPPFPEDDNESDSDSGNLFSSHIESDTTPPLEQGLRDKLPDLGSNKNTWENYNDQPPPLNNEACQGENDASKEAGGSPQADVTPAQVATTRQIVNKEPAIKEVLNKDSGDASSKEGNSKQAFTKENDIQNVKTQKQVSKQEPSSIFDEEDYSEDLFKTGTKSNTSTTQSKPNLGSLFDDDDDDDIFKSSQTISKSKKDSIMVTAKPSQPTTSVVSKTKLKTSSSDFKDPLLG